MSKSTVRKLILTACLVAGSLGATTSASGQDLLPTPIPIEFVVSQQVGNDIDGSDTGIFGFSIDLSADGTRVVVGAPDNRGTVRVFQLFNGRWSQLGPDIDGGNGFGEAVAMSSDGSTIAVGIPWLESVQVMTLENGTWVQVGGTLRGLASFGRSLVMTEDGRRIVVGAPFSNANGEFSGQVQVFDLVNGSWRQVGGDINGGESLGLGTSVATNADGTRLITNLYPRNEAPEASFVYELVDGAWLQVGPPIPGGEGAAIHSQTVAMSGDGNRVALTSPYGLDRATETRIYDLVGGRWQQVGNTLGSWAEVTITPDGSRVVAGNPYADRVGVFELQDDEWVETFFFEGSGFFGNTVAVTPDGASIAIGATSGDFVRVYSIPAIRAADDSPIDPPSDPTDPQPSPTPSDDQQTPGTPDELLCHGLPVTVNLDAGDTPTEGDDVINGTPGDDLIDGLGGDDTICGLQGDDDITGGDGNDHILAGSGADRLEGGIGNDLLVGGPGNDTIIGGEGFDQAFAGGGNDQIEGGVGNDKLVGGPGDDTIFGGNGNDRIQGGPGIDTINGDGGQDQISGGDGNDVIRGGAADDRLFGNLGRDTLFGELGNDVLRGGAWLDSMDGGPGSNDGCTLSDPSGLTEVRVNCESGVFGR